MFTQKELSQIDHDYFMVKSAGCYGVTLLSKCTKHCWYITNEDYGSFHTCTIFHTHHEGTSMHEHGHGRNLHSCIRQIQSHDEYQLRKDASRRRRNRYRRRMARIEAEELITTI